MDTNQGNQDAVNNLIADVKKAFSDPQTRDKYLASLEYDTGVAGPNGKAETVAQIRKARQQMRSDGSASNTKPVSQEAMDQFNSYTPEERRAVMNTGTLPTRFHPEAEQALADLRAHVDAMRLPSGNALSKMNNEAISNKVLADVSARNRQIINDQFGRPMYLGEDPLQHLYSQLKTGPGEIAGYFNPNQTGALAEQLQRLEAQYPGTMSRLAGLRVGRSNFESWIEDKAPRAFAQPGEIPYEIGFPASPRALRGLMPTAPTGAERMANLTGQNPDWWAAGRSPELYNDIYQSTAAHELGHAVQYGLLDWTQDPANFNKLSGVKVDMLTSQLANSPANSISGYAEQARQQAQERGVAQASKEPFAELFSVARSEPGMDLYNGQSSPAIVKALIGNRTGPAADKLMDRIGQLNAVEKTARNEGWGEVGSAEPGMLGMMAAPLALGLAAAKAPKPVQSTLAGAAAGAGLGGFLGPEGAVAGGTIGAAFGLGKQLL